METDRRLLLQSVALGLPGLFLSGCGGAMSGAQQHGITLPPSPASPPVAGGLAPALPALFDDIELRTFRYFWERTNPANGLVPDRWPTPSFSSIAAIGFGLTAYILGAERGWISRSDARQRTLTTLRFLSSLPMGPEPSGVAGYRGFFYHFLDMGTGLRHGHVELSTVDTALLHMGMLHAAAWFDGNDGGEADIRRLTTEMVDAAEWDWFQQNGPAIPMGWHPESGFIERVWDGYNEAKLVYILALGSGGHPARGDSWDAWTAPYPQFWRGTGASRRLAFGPALGHQYSEMWIDFRGIFDAPMRAAGLDYFENGRRAALAQQAYAVANPMGWDGYGADIWGLAPCDGPGHFPNVMRGGTRVQFEGYFARGPVGEPDGFDDGTIAPWAALGFLPFAPEICIPAAVALHEQHGARIYGQYGFLDAFNPSFKDASLRLEGGTVDPVHGWVASDWLGLDQGPILGMIGNYRNEAIWRVMRRSPHIIRGLRRAGFSGGWLDQAG
ncbi:MAG: glucoamylase family protein [Sphingopyxis sp.]